MTPMVYVKRRRLGHMKMTYPFDPTFEVIDEESMAYDSKRHRLTLFNTTGIPGKPFTYAQRERNHSCLHDWSIMLMVHWIDLLMTIDLVTKQSIAQVPLNPQPGQQVCAFLFTFSLSISGYMYLCGCIGITNVICPRFI
jgi:hypothetical protein